MKIIFFLTVIFVFYCCFSIISFASPQLGASAVDSVENNLNINVSVKPELFPIFAELLTEKNFTFNLPELVHWSVKNMNEETISLSFISEIPEWTQPVINTIEIAPGQNKTFAQTPFGKKLLDNKSITPTTIILKVKKDGNIIFEETQNLNIRSVDEMIWSLYQPYDMVSLIAAWVTPKDPIIEEILSNATSGLFRVQLSGYINTNPSGVKKQVKAIFNSVRKYNIGFVNSNVTFGKVGLFTQRVRFPRESIMEKSANCIDGTVLLASLCENIGLEPLIILIPDHAFLGVRLAPNSNQILFIETTALGFNLKDNINSLSTAFSYALNKGNEEYSDIIQKNPRSMIILDIKKLRAMGLYPFK